MKIILQSLRLKDFKGIRALVVLFGHVTNIYGDNATGKTTLEDAWSWLLFGKDSTDRKDFEIKTLGPDNKPYRQLDHEVEGVLNVDGSEINLRRVYREKWTKKRGSLEAEFTGHETLYFWNDVPMSQAEYQKAISDILDEGMFKLITSTTYFNNMKWQERRGVLSALAGKISTEDVFAEMDSAGIGYAQIQKAFAEKKTLEQFKRELAAKRKNLKEQLELLPSRIDEANRSLPDPVDYSKIEEAIAAVEADIQNVEGLLMNKSKAQKDHQVVIGDLLTKRQNLSRMALDIEFQLKQQVQERKQSRESNIHDQKRTLRSKQDEVLRLRTDYSNLDSRKIALEKEQTGLRDKWNAIDAERLDFKEGEFHCPACKREYEASDVATMKAELTANFNSSKTARLKEITDRGLAIGAEVGDLVTRMGNIKAQGEALNAEITTITTRIADLETEHNRLSADDDQQLQQALATHKQYQQCKTDIEVLNDQINAPYTGEDNSELMQRKRDLQGQLDDLKAKLSSKGQREKQLARIEELQGQESTMAQELAGLEGIEYSIEQFTKIEMDTLEKRVNGRFKIVRFKMFEDQINGGQAEACTTLIGGVPYADANTAAKIQAGIDIINTLSEHYGVQAPVWVDNRESVVRLPETNCQLINLIVSEADKALRIESNEMAEAVA